MSYNRGGSLPPSNQTSSGQPQPKPQLPELKEKFKTNPFLAPAKPIENTQKILHRYVKPYQSRPVSPTENQYNTLDVSGPFLSQNNGPSPPRKMIKRPKNKTAISQPGSRQATPNVSPRPDHVQPHQTIDVTDNDLKTAARTKITADHTLLQKPNTLTPIQPPETQKVTERQNNFRAKSIKTKTLAPIQDAEDIIEKRSTSNNNHQAGLEFIPNTTSVAKNIRGASPDTIDAFTMAKKATPFFPEKQRVYAVSTDDEDVYGFSQADENLYRVPHIALNRANNKIDDNPDHQKIRTAATGVHELAVHMQYDVLSRNNKQPLESADHQHSRMFDPDEREKPNSYLAGIRNLKKNNPGFEEVIADKFYDSTSKEIALALEGNRITMKQAIRSLNWAKERQESLERVEKKATPSPAKQRKGSRSPNKQRVISNANTLNQ